MERFLYIALGAAAGANARYLVGLWAADRFGAAFPAGTLVVNVTGSLMLGVLYALAGSRLDISPELRLLAAVGFLGSYTTFSSYTVESLALLQEGGLWAAAANVAGNNLLGLGAAVLGYSIGRALGS